MRVPNFVLNYAKNKLMPLSREIPDEVIGAGYRWRKKSGAPFPGDSDKPFLIRWFVIPKNKWLNIYLHKFCRDDEDRALHDHPWLNLSLLLINRYIEVTAARGKRVHPQQTLPEERNEYRAGELRARLATTPHRVELCRDRKGRPIPSWSLFITGPVTRVWGFHCPGGWRTSRQFGDEGGCGIND